MRFKRCGITAGAEGRMLAGQRVGVGFRYGVPSGPYELPLREVRTITRAARAATLDPLLVTRPDAPRRLTGAVSALPLPDRPFAPRRDRTPPPALVGGATACPAGGTACPTALTRPPGTPPTSASGTRWRWRNFP